MCFICDRDPTKCTAGMQASCNAGSLGHDGMPYSLNPARARVPLVYRVRKFPPRRHMKPQICPQADRDRAAMLSPPRSPPPCHTLNPDQPDLDNNSVFMICKGSTTQNTCSKASNRAHKLNHARGTFRLCMIGRTCLSP
jgi:hypothetical protein